MFIYTWRCFFLFVQCTLALLLDTTKKLATALSSFAQALAIQCSLLSLSISQLRQICMCCWHCHCLLLTCLPLQTAILALVVVGGAVAAGNMRSRQWTNGLKKSTNTQIQQVRTLGIYTIAQSACLIGTNKACAMKPLLTSVCLHISGSAIKRIVLLLP